MACAARRRLSARSCHRRAAGRGARARHAAGDRRRRGRRVRCGSSSAATRASRATWIEQELARGAGSEGASVTSAGVIPTPAIAYVTPAMAFDAGIVISASHNPFEDNGIKVFSGKGEKFTETLEREVEAIMARHGLGSAGLGRLRALRSHQRRSTRTSRIRGWRCRIRAACAARKLAIDTANGATTTVAPRLFAELGFDVRRPAATTPDGRNINLDCGSTHPDGLSRAVREQRMPDGRGVRRRRRSRDLRRRRRAHRRRRRRAADVRAAPEGAAGG